MTHLVMSVTLSGSGKRRSAFTQLARCVRPGRAYDCPAPAKRSRTFPDCVADGMARLTEGA